MKALKFALLVFVVLYSRISNAFPDRVAEDLRIEQLLIGTSISIEAVSLKPSPVLRFRTRLGRNMNYGEITPSYFQNGNLVEQKPASGSYCVIWPFQGNQVTENHDSKLTTEITANSALVSTVQETMLTFKNNSWNIHTLSCVKLPRDARLSDISIILGANLSAKIAIDPTDYQIRAVGILVSPDPEAAPCTATYVGENKVLTAAHCLVNGHGKLYNKLFFLPGFRGDWYNLAKSVRSSNNVENLLPILSDSITPSKSGLDFAVIKIDLDRLDSGINLDDLADVSNSDTLLFSEPQENQNVFIAGYPNGEHFAILSGRGVSRINTSATGSFDHSCSRGEICSNTAPGTSGAPLLVKLRDGRFVVVGIHIGQTSDATGRAISSNAMLDELNLDKPSSALQLFSTVVN